jgi:choline kinase
VDSEGHILELSKSVAAPLGEAIGINFVGQSDKFALIDGLVAADDTDYFERGIEIAIDQSASTFLPVDISDFYAVEVDFEDDMVEAQRLSRDT